MIGRPGDFARKLIRWYCEHRRDLPWRLPFLNSAGQTLNPYHVLVSEAMLQQTQVATVIPYFNRFITKFPTPQMLAEADLQEVLHAWQGLGYYSRAKNLRAAAIKIVAEYGGVIPPAVDQLLTLPGIGRYTAGAISSIAFGRRAPILDGNVARVLCRIDAVESDPREKITREKLWERAEEILPRKQLGDFNSALMELGALICTPRSPQCLICPVRSCCDAQAAGIQERIPPPKPAKATPLLKRWVFCIRHGDQYRVEQRPATGRWAGMWQFATLEAGEGSPTSQLLSDRYKLETGEPVSIGTVEHALTHRRYRFEVFTCESKSAATGQWAALLQLHDRPMPRPHLKIREMLELIK